MTNEQKLAMFKEMLEAELNEIYLREESDKATERKRDKVAEDLDNHADMWNNKGQGVWNCLRILGIESEYLNWAKGKNDFRAFSCGEYNEL